MSNPQGNRGGDAAREREERDDRERRFERPSGLSSCPHGVKHFAGQAYNCPACTAAKAALQAAEAAQRAGMVSDARSAAERRYDEGTPLADTKVSSVETCDEKTGRWVYVPVESFLADAPEARLVALPGSRLAVVRDRENEFPLAWR